MSIYLRRALLLVAALLIFTVTMNGVSLVAHWCPLASLPVAFVGIPGAVWLWMGLQRRVTR